MTEEKLLEIFSKFNKTKVLVIGDSILDIYISGPANRISPEAPVLIVQKESVSYKAGGAANVAMNLSVLGAKTTLITSANQNDENGKILLEILSNGGIVAVTGNENHTITKTRIVSSNQQIVRVDDEKEKEHYEFHFGDNEIEYLKQNILDNDIVILSDYNKGVINQKLIDIISDFCIKNGKFIALDPKPSNKISFKNLDLITPNLKEAQELIGGNFSTQELFVRLDDRFNSKNTVITLGSDGLGFYKKNSDYLNFPPFTQEVFDVCGAGDTAISVLSLMLGNKYAIEESAQITNIACGVVVGKHGTATVSQKEILDMVISSKKV